MFKKTHQNQFILAAPFCSHVLLKRKSQKVLGIQEKYLKFHFPFCTCSSVSINHIFCILHKLSYEFIILLPDVKQLF